MHVKNKAGLHKAGSLSRSAWKLFAQVGDIVDIAMLSIAAARGSFWGSRLSGSHFAIVRAAIRV